MSINLHSKITVCEKCKTEFITNDLLDNADKDLKDNISVENVEKALKYNSYIVKANEELNDEKFDQAEKYFKLAISENEERFEGYYGVAKAKTKNFKIMPQTMDYLEYCKLAIDRADEDEKYQIIANMAKLNITK